MGQTEVTIPEPKLLLIDFPETVNEAITSLGYNVNSGSFGTPYNAKSGSYAWLNHNLPSIHEQQIIFIDLEEPTVKDETEPPPMPKNYKSDSSVLSVPNRQSYFNPRPFVAQAVSDYFSEVIHKGGIIIAFASSEYTEKSMAYKWGEGNPIGEEEANNYSWSPIQVYVGFRRGTEITFNDDMFGNLSRSVNQPVFYSAIFEYLDEEKDYVIARNSLGEAVGFARRIQDGCIIFLPRFEDFTPVIEIMLKETLVDLAPKLFPNSTRHTWLTRPEYQWPQAKKLQSQRKEIDEEYKTRISNLDEQINAERERLEFLHSILKSTGDSLVENLALTLELIGFENVEVVDKTTQGQREEDIQILYGDQPIIMEVKGLAGNPSEADLQQLLKYIIRRHTELDRTDVKGVFITNHQRHIPGLERESAFTNQQIEDAEKSKYAITTTWDLFHAIINCMNELLEYDDIIAAITSQIGEIEYLPRHYKEIGKITHYYPEPQAVIIELFEGEELKKGDSVGFLGENQRYEQSVESLMVDEISVNEVESTVEFGLQVNKPVSKMHRFFKIES